MKNGNDSSYHFILRIQGELSLKKKKETTISVLKGQHMTWQLSLKGPWHGGLAGM